MAERTSEYWQERFKQMEEAQHDQSVQKALEMQEQFDRSLAVISGKIEAWYQRYADNNGVSLTDARRMLQERELKELKWNIEDYIRYGKENAIDGRWRKELENASARAHISRLDALKLEVQQEMEKLYGNYNDTVDRHIRDIYANDYYHTAYEIQKGIGIGAQLSGLDTRQLEKVIKKPWAVDGQNFSDRIWMNKTKTINELYHTLTTMCITGSSPQRAISEFTKTMQVSRAQASRIILTESAVMASQASQDSMKDLGVEQYEVIGTLDGRTCESCGEMDRKHFPMSEFQIGVTAPPFHPNCRCDTCPYFEEDFGVKGERAARGEDGKTYYVPADMTYKEWKGAFVDGNSEAAHMIKNSKKEKPDRTIEEINNSGTDELLNSYDDRRKHFELNETPADELRGKVLNPITVNYNGISIESARVFNETITDLSMEYYTGFTKIEVGDKKKYFGVNTFATTIHQNNVGNKTLVLNPHKVADYNKMSGRIRELSDKGYCVKIADGMEAKYIATHEFAHSLIDMEQPLKNYVGYDTKRFNRIRKEIKSAFDEYKTEVESLEAVYRKKEMEFMTASAEDMPKVQTEVLELKEKLNDVKISRYSMNNADEFMAEAFAQDKLGVSHSKYSDRVMEILDKNFKKDIAGADAAARDRLGFITNNNKSDPKYYDFKGKDIKTVEQEISKRDYETAVIFDKGKAINCQIGNEDTVKFTGYQLKQMKGRDITHNHPLSTAPSPEDLYLLVDHKAKSFRTCGKNGTYVLEYNEQIENLPDFKTFSDSYDEIIYELRNKYYNEVQNGMKKEDALIALGEAVWERLYELYNVKPRFERW